MKPTTRPRPAALLAIFLLLLSAVPKAPGRDDRGEEGGGCKLVAARAFLAPPGDGQPLTVALEVSNRCPEPAVSSGALSLLAGSTEVAGVVEIGELRLLPGEVKTVRVSRDGKLAPGPYTAVVRLDYAPASAPGSPLNVRMPFVVRGKRAAIVAAARSVGSFGAGTE